MDWAAVYKWEIDKKLRVLLSSCVRTDLDFLADEGVVDDVFRLMSILYCYSLTIYGLYSKLFYIYLQRECTLFCKHNLRRSQCEKKKRGSAREVTAAETHMVIELLQFSCTWCRRADSCIQRMRCIKLARSV